MSAFTFKLAYLNPVVFRKKFFGKWVNAFPFWENDGGIVPLYRTVGQSSIGEIPFVSQSAILYKETHHLYMEAQGPRGKLTMMGWGNIPGVQQIDPESLFTQGAYFSNYDAKEVHVAVGGQVEILSYNKAKNRLKLSFEFEMQQTDELFNLAVDSNFQIKGNLDIVDLNRQLFYEQDSEEVDENRKAGIET